ncbi:membrane protein PM19L [Tanacetum coccineum]
MATGYVAILSLLAGVVGITTSATGINNVAQWKASNLYAASASALISWSLTLLAMGFACKEIDIGWSGSTLRALEVILIIVSGTQLFSMVTIQAGIEKFHGSGGKSLSIKTGLLQVRKPRLKTCKPGVDVDLMTLIWTLDDN